MESYPPPDGEEPRSRVPDIVLGIGVTVIVAAIAVAMAIDVAGRRAERDAQRELIALLPTVHGEEVADGEVAVLGVRLERAADGSICLWRTLDDGTVVGLWDHPGGPAASHPHIGIFDAVPVACPSSDRVFESGFRDFP